MKNETLNLITDFLFYETEIPNKIDLILVFWNNYRNTMEDLKSLSEKIVFNKILITGWNELNWKKECEFFLEKGLLLWFEKELFLIENKATNTKENVIFSKEILEEFKFEFNCKKILILCKWFHSRRVLMTLNKYFYKDIEFYFHHLNDWMSDKNNWANNEKTKNRIFKEIERIWTYLSKGDLM